LCRARCPGERRLRRILGERVEVRPDVTKRSVVARLAATKPDLLVSWFWTTRLPKALLGIAPLGSIGVHPSLLPRHRGPDPTFWAIDRGDTVTGVTAHVLAEEYDTGALYAQRTLAIDPRWNAWNLAKRLDAPSLRLLRELVRDFAEGRAPVPRPQDEALATEAPLPSDELLEIDWRADAEAIERRVRAAAPRPGAYAFLGDGDDPVMLTRVVRHDDAPRALAPGEAWALARNAAGIAERAAVKCGRGALELAAGWVEDEDGGEVWLDGAALARRAVPSADPL
jgi:methionyl-tRNA formyltransferase